MGISDKIESFIIELLKDEDDWLELKRNELAKIFNCVPSQINYVMATRFNEQRGYVFESRRGGGGYIRVKRLNSNNNNLLINIISQIGNSLDFDNANSIIQYLFSKDNISKREADIIICGIQDKNFNMSKLERDNLRAIILKNMLVSLI